MAGLSQEGQMYFEQALEEALQNLLRRWHPWIFVACGAVQQKP